MSKVVEQLYSKELVQRLKEMKVLVIGAGGIGCELLKQLMKVEWSEVHILDLDTIEISNLNR